MPAHSPDRFCQFINSVPADQASHALSTAVGYGAGWVFATDGIAPESLGRAAQLLRPGAGGRTPAPVERVSAGASSWPARRAGFFGGLAATSSLAALVDFLAGRPSVLALAASLRGSWLGVAAAAGACAALPARRRPGLRIGVADDLDVVPLGIAHERRVVVRVVVGAQAGPAVVACRRPPAPRRETRRRGRARRTTPGASGSLAGPSASTTGPAFRRRPGRRRPGTA